jgi:hypothetical protein
MKKLIVIICSTAIAASLGIAVLSVAGASGAIPLFPVSQVECEFRNYDDSYLWDTKVNYGTEVEYLGATPYRADDIKNTYTFSGWDISTDKVETNTVFHAQYYPIAKELKVSFQNYDHTPLYTTYTTYGGKAEYQGPTPTRPTDASYRYTFKGWDKSFDAITEDTVVTALYDTDEVKWTVTFKNYDGKVLYTDHVATGESAVYQGMTPIKKSTDTIDYVFKEWDKGLDNVKEDFTTTALFEERAANLTVQFLNWDSSLLYTDHVSYGGTADYFGMTPVRESSAEYVYTFLAWNKELTNITSDTTVIARFSKQTRNYVVSFRNYDGSLLGTDSVAYGSSAFYSGGTPEKPEDDKYTYTFSGWDRDIKNITGDLETYAVYEKALRIFDVIFQNYDGQFLETDKVTYGDTAVYYGATPVRPGDLYTTYTFEKWDKELKNITADTVFTAQFTAVQNGGGGADPEGWLVTFQNYDGTYMDADIVNDGEAAVYRGANFPTRPMATINNNSYYYSFVNWDKENDEMLAVHRDFATFAQYKTSDRYIVTYRGPSNQLLYEDYVYPGNSSYYAGEVKDYLDPKNGFVGWSRSLVNIQTSITVYPKFKEAKSS